MINLTKLICGGKFDSDRLRYSENLLQTAPVVVWNLTRTCNLCCKHCYIEAESTPEKGELSHRQAKELIGDLAGFGVKVLLFSGGEPLLRKDIFSLSRYANMRGIRTALSTNGTLITSETAQKLKKANFSYVGISIDGKPKTHDKFRGQKGAFNNALKGIKNCQAQKIKVGIRFTLAKSAIKDIPFIFNLMERENIQRICFYHMVNTGRAYNLEHEMLDAEQNRKALNLICRKTQEISSKSIAANKKYEVLTVDNHADGPYLYLKSQKEFPARSDEIMKLLKLNKGNSSGVGIACINHLGEVYPDQFWNKISLGNVKEKNFSEIWQDNSNKLLVDLRDRKYFIKGRCSHCRFFDVCNGNFRARASAAADDIWAEDPACYLTDKEIKGGKNEFSRN